VKEKHLSDALFVASGASEGHIACVKEQKTYHEVPSVDRGCWPALHEFYRSSIDATLIDENLKLSVPQRMDKFASFMHLVEGARSSRKAPGE
jgi:hypothetical protein